MKPNFFGRKRTEVPSLRSSQVWKDYFRYWSITERRPRAQAEQLADESTNEYWEKKRRTAGQDVAFQRNGRSGKMRKSKADFESKKTLNELVSYFAKKEGVAKEDLREFREELLESINPGRYGDWGDSISLTADGNEYNLILDTDEAERIAIEMTKQNMEEDPEMFGDFLSGYLTITPTDKRIIAQEEADRTFEDMSDRDIRDDYERQFGGAEDKDVDEMREELVEDHAETVEQELSDPVNYFVNVQGIYDLESLMQQPWIRVDTDEAARDAVRADGFEHFLSTYDGNYDETPSGIVVMKE